MHAYGKPALPTLRLERLKHKGESSEKGSHTHRKGYDSSHTSRKARATRQPQPPQHRRGGYGFAALVADGTPQTSRVTTLNKKKPIPPTETMTARPPTNDKSGQHSSRPRSNRHYRHSPATETNPMQDGPITAPVSYTHLRAHETPEHLVCRLLLEKKKKKKYGKKQIK
eukprot:TRINITY_DN1998_c0_g4_i2.p1 TRINITY_DN1998_c0_g4~~TRINITY_DN1998_c0_g4_i2.p1  ORF type:complete len:169 (-),score=28.51 TRINITY_DN1998_c0_g4_i2:22-528(-)